MAKQILKTTVSSSYWLQPHLLDLLKPARYLQLHSLCHPLAVFLTPSEQVPNPSHRFPSLTPQSHPCDRTWASLLPPHPLTPYIHLCLLVSCNSHDISLQRDLSSKALYLFLFLSHFSTSNQKQNSHGASEHAYTLAYKGASGLTLFYGYLCECNTSKVPGCHSLPISEEYPQSKSLHENSHSRTANTQ